MSDPKPIDGGGAALPAPMMFCLHYGAEITLAPLPDGDVAIDCEQRDPYVATTAYARPAEARKIGHTLIKMADELDAYLAARKEPTNKEPHHDGAR